LTAFIRDVNGSDNAPPYSLPYFFGGFKLERIMVRYKFECGLYQTTDSDRK
jgi:hypothetical protein